MRSRVKMESVYFINLIFIFVLNVIFFFSGVCLNSVVIISYWRSVQLRKKLCYFMIMVLSCCDLLGVVTNTPLVAVVAMLLMTGKLDVNARWPHLASRLAVALFVSSTFALTVLNFERYLATYYPIFHRTSVTKGRLSILLTILIVVEITLTAMSANDTVFSYQVHILILFVFLFPTMLFTNYKLFRAVEGSRRNNRISPKENKTFSLTKISSCLLVVACYVVLSIPIFVYIGLKMSSRDTTLTLGSAYLAGIWSKTIASMNSTFNCLIFYWKNRVLRTEGWKVITDIKLW